MNRVSRDVNVELRNTEGAVYADMLLRCRSESLTKRARRGTEYLAAIFGCGRMLCPLAHRSRVLEGIGVSAVWMDMSVKLLIMSVVVLVALCHL